MLTLSNMKLWSHFLTGLNLEVAIGAKRRELKKSLIEYALSDDPLTAEKEIATHKLSSRDIAFP